MRTCIAVLILSGLAGVLSGCGGGGGGISATTRVAPAEVGSSYTYDVVVTYGRGEDSTVGTMSLTISASGQVLSKRGLIQMADGTSSSVETFFTQDSSGSLLYAGERDPADGQALLSSTRPVAVRSPLLAGDKWTSSAALDSGITVTWNSLVGAPESIAAGGRIYSAFAISTTRTSGSGSTSYTAWYSPECPAPVKAVGRAGGVEVTIVLCDPGNDIAGPDDLDSPPAPPSSGGSTSGSSLDAPPPFPTEWLREWQDVAAIVGEMLN